MHRRWTSRNEVRVGQAGLELNKPEVATINPPEKSNNLVFRYNKYMALYYVYIARVAEVRVSESCVVMKFGLHDIKTMLKIYRKTFPI